MVRGAPLHTHQHLSSREISRRQEGLVVSIVTARRSCPDVLNYKHSTFSEALVWLLILPRLTFTPCICPQSKAHRAGTVVTVLHHARWTATAGAVLQHHLISRTSRSRTGSWGNCGIQRSCCRCKNKKRAILGETKRQIRREARQKPKHSHVVAGAWLAVDSLRFPIVFSIT